MQGKVAVITGAASGIGKALSTKALQLGMKVVLADINPTDLEQTRAELTSLGTVLAVPTDVSRPEQLELLAQKAFEAFGAVHLLCNNAGVSDSRPLWQSEPLDWSWVFGVNVFAIGYALQSFVPRMLQQGQAAHIVNTASVAGLVSGSGFGIYRASKHAAVALSETLAHELAQQNAPISVHVLCPGWVRTRIVSSARNRPGGPPPLDRAAQKSSGIMHKIVEGGIEAFAVAEQVFEAIEKQRFYILTHPEMTPAIAIRAKDLLEGRNPRDTFAQSLAKNPVEPTQT